MNSTEFAKLKLFYNFHWVHVIITRRQNHARLKIAQVKFLRQQNLTRNTISLHHKILQLKISQDENCATRQSCWHKIMQYQKSPRTKIAQKSYDTVRWYNFVRRDPKMGAFLQSIEATPADIFLNESLPPKTPCRYHVHGHHGHGSPVKNHWRFSKFCKKGKKKKNT
jgi:hypothetical protein